MRLIVAYSELQDATEEERAAKAIIISFARAFGPGVWREGHPLDRAKVSRPRSDRGRLIDARLNLAYALRCEPAVGRPC
jgi:hypothetical protein